MAYPSRPGSVSTEMRKFRWDALAPLIVLPLLVLVGVPTGVPRWAFMWILAFAIFVGCKWLSWRGVSLPPAPAWKHLAYLVTWPGLDATTFLEPRPSTEKPTVGEWLLAGGKTLAGLLLLGIAIHQSASNGGELVGWMGMVGIVTTLHFGAFHLLSCFWRSFGANARVLMNAPLRSVSVSEFWGQRWNTAFRDLTHRFLFRPLTARLGPKGAVFAGFVVSGLVHDLVISVPAGGGYGLPTLFFLVQGCAVFGERLPIARRAGLGRGLAGRAFTLFVLLGPLVILFHPPFNREVILPFLRFLDTFV